VPATPVYALPYPTLSDTADVPRDIQALATKLDTGMAPKVVTALPGSPVDGQEALFQSSAMAALGVAWSLRYRAGASGSYKWEFVGGASMLSEIAGEANIAPSAGWGDLAGSAGPDIATPLAGDWEYTIVAYGKGNNAGVTNQGGIGLAIGAAATPTGGEAVYMNVINQQAQNLTSAGRLNAIPAGTTLRLRYVAVSATYTLTYGGRKILLRPIRVG
jgi:hypothetical protein